MIRIAKHTVVLLAVSAAAALAQPAQAPADMYKVACAMCHDTGAGRAPRVDTFKEMAPEVVLNALENGPMVSMAQRFNPAQRRIIAEYLTGKALSGTFSLTPSDKAMCAGATPGTFTVPASGPLWNGWGLGDNARFQSTAAAGITAADVPKLKLKWAFGFPGEMTRMGASTLAGGRIFVGSATGIVYALNASTGCVHWYLEAGAAVRSAPTLAQIPTANGQRWAIFFGDARAFEHAVDAETGKEIWRTKLDDFPVAGVTSGAAFYKNRIYVGVRSGEEGSGADPKYECCKFRGSLVALDAATGKQVWKTYTTDEPKPTKKNSIGTQMWGPAGAPIWSTPIPDARRNAIYATTGNSYSEPSSRYSDAFVAFDADSGKILWSHQFTEHDSYVSACRLPDKSNCPDDGPDFDFASSPIVVNLSNGKRALIAGQKSGMVHALDPDQQGELLWSTRVGKGGTMGGVQWGSASDGENVYVANSDIGRIMLNYSNMTDADPKQGGGMYALRLRDGKQVWYTPPPGCGEKTRCSPAQSQAVTAIPGVAFSGSVDGHLRAYSAKDGKIVWDVDTVMPFNAVNGVTARGGSLDGAGPVIGGGMLYVNSGYSSAGGQPGNVLLAFSVDGK
jgi:polyvinyl alcohol dehydrogenase (cytochrome)